MSRIRQYQSSMGVQSGDEPTSVTHWSHQPSRPARLAPLVVLPLVTLAAGHWLADSWLQPTAVGLMWGALFLLACGAGSGLVGSLAESFGCGVLVYLCWQSAAQLTDVPAAENLLVLGLLGGTGWISGRWLPHLTHPMVHRSLAECRAAPGHWLRGPQWSLADMLSLTTFVGCLAWGIPRLAAGTGLMTEVWLTLAAALLGSLLATAWVWTDHWNVRRLTTLAALLMCLLAAVGLGPVGDELRLSLVAASPSQAPPGKPIFSLLYLSRVLTGPATVVAAQALSVMFTQAWWRWLNRTHGSTLHALEPTSGVKLCLTSLD